MGEFALNIRLLFSFLPRTTNHIFVDINYMGLIFVGSLQNCWDIHKTRCRQNEL